MEMEEDEEENKEEEEKNKSDEGEEEERGTGQSATAVISEGLIADRKFPQSAVTFLDLKRDDAQLTMRRKVLKKKKIFFKKLKTQRLSY